MSLTTDLAGALAKASTTTKNDLSKIFEAYSNSRDGSRSDSGAVMDFVRHHMGLVSAAGTDLVNGVYSEVYSNLVGAAPGSGSKLFPNADSFWNASLQLASQVPGDMAVLGAFYGTPTGASNLLSEAIVARGESLHAPFNKEYGAQSYLSHLAAFFKG
jgi:hypothetical protein